VALHKCDGACAGKEPAETYNVKANDWIQSVYKNNGRILIREKGRHLQEQAAILFENGILKAYGFVDTEADVYSSEDLLHYLSPVKPVSETYSILQSFIGRQKMDMILLDA